MWFGSWTVKSRRGLFQVVRTAQRIVGAALRDLDCVYADCLQRKMRFISTDKTHTGHPVCSPTFSEEVLHFKNVDHQVGG